MGLRTSAASHESCSGLVDLCECEDLYVGHEPYLAPATPRWISVGDGVSAYLGVSEPPEGLSLVDSGHGDIVRRLQVDTDEDAATLELAGVQEMSLAEWLVPPSYLRHASRRMRKPARSDAVSLGGFWELLEKALTDEGLMLGADAEVRFLGGHPGEFFARRDSLQPEGEVDDRPGRGAMVCLSPRLRRYPLAPLHHRRGWPRPAGIRPLRRG